MLKTMLDILQTLSLSLSAVRISCEPMRKSLIDYISLKQLSTHHVSEPTIITSYKTQTQIEDISELLKIIEWKECALLTLHGKV